MTNCWPVNNCLLGLVVLSANFQLPGTLHLHLFFFFYLIFFLFIYFFFFKASMSLFPLSWRIRNFFCHTCWSLPVPKPPLESQVLQSLLNWQWSRFFVNILRWNINKIKNEQHLKQQILHVADHFLRPTFKKICANYSKSYLIFSLWEKLPDFLLTNETWMLPYRSLF